jgi:ubiquitin C-terminal hydrolase
MVRFDVRVGPALPFLLQYMLRVSSTLAFADLPPCAIGVAQAYLKRNPLDAAVRQVVEQTKLPVPAAALAKPAAPGSAGSAEAVLSLSGEHTASSTSYSRAMLILLTISLPLPASAASAAVAAPASLPTAPSRSVPASSVSVSNPPPSSSRVPPAAPILLSPLPDAALPVLPPLVAVSLPLTGAPSSSSTSHPSSSPAPPSPAPCPASDLSPALRELPRRGLVNYDNVCYATAALPCLARFSAMAGPLQQSHLFADLCKELSRASHDPVWLDQSLPAAAPPVAPGAFDPCGRLLDLLRTGHQQDANEFVRLTFDHVLGTLPNTCQEVQDQRPFVWGTTSTISCPCGFTSTSPEEPEYVLELELPDSSAPVTLQQLIGKHFAAESVSGYACPSCERTTTVSKTLSLSRVPRLAAITVKRFGSDTRKIFTPVVADHIDLRAGQLQRCAVVAHRGRTLAAGHYVSYCKHPPTSGWLHFNDAHPVRDVGSHLPEAVLTEGYVFFFCLASSPLQHSPSAPSSVVPPHPSGRAAISPRRASAVAAATPSSPPLFAASRSPSSPRGSASLASAARASSPPSAQAASAPSSVAAVPIQPATAPASSSPRAAAQPQGGGSR